MLSFYKETAQAREREIRFDTKDTRSERLRFIAWRVFTDRIFWIWIEAVANHDFAKRSAGKLDKGRTAVLMLGIYITILMTFLSRQWDNGKVALCLGAFNYSFLFWRYSKSDLRAQRESDLRAGLILPCGNGHSFYIFHNRAVLLLPFNHVTFSQSTQWQSSNFVLLSKRAGFVDISNIQLGINNVPWECMQRNSNDRNRFRNICLIVRNKTKSSDCYF